MSLRIAVVGGGIGGLATAAFLHRRGLNATVYEQASEIREIGAGAGRADSGSHPQAAR